MHIPFGILLPLILHFSHIQYLFKRRVRDTEAAEADVHQSFLQLPEEAGIGPGLKVTIGKQVGQLLANGLNQTSLWNMMMDQGCDTVQVTWTAGRSLESVYYCDSTNIIHVVKPKTAAFSDGPRSC